MASGSDPFAMFNLPTPGAYSYLASNKLYGCIMVYFIANAIETQLISTGAFEVLFNDMPIWSKLDTGRIPQPDEFFQIIESQMRYA